MKARLAIAVLGSVLLARCGCGSDPWVLATVTVDEAAVTRCVRVVARAADGGGSPSGAMPVAPGGELTVAVFEGALGPDFSLRAEGHGDPGCAGAMDEASPWTTAHLASGEPGQVPLPIRPEGLCSDGNDGDGDGLIDCADRACQDAPECGGGADAGDGGSPDAGGFPYAPSNFLPGQVPAPTTGLTITCDAGYDTTSASGYFCGAPVPAGVPITMAGAAQALLLPLGPLTITDAGRLTVTGDRPLILAVLGDARIDGPLLAGADLTRPGPGGSRTSCPGDGEPGVVGGGGGAGGGGGGYGQAGAGGGVAGTNGAGTAGRGGTAFGAVELVPLLGGCSGGPGGESTSGCLRSGGAGGGALQLSASGVLRVGSAIAAPGGGGQGGDPNDRCGGGGGGSGGAILLEALRLELSGTARLTANGGAGAEGGDNAPSSLQFGQNGRTDGPHPARGGDSATGVGTGGDGGAGSVAPLPGGPYPATNGGGGGGGAGAGRIRLNSVEGCVLAGSPNLLFSPKPSSNLAGDAGCP